MRSETLPVQLLDFAGRLAAARSLDELGRRYLAGVRRLIPLPAAGLYLLEPDGRTPWHVAAVGVSDFFLSRYEKFGRAQDPVFAEVRRTRRPVSSWALMSEDRWRPAPVYSELHRLHRWTLCLQAPILAGGRFVGTLNFGGPDDVPVVDEQHLALLEPLGRLVGAAAQSAIAAHDERRRHERVLAALSLSDEAIVISDAGTGERTVSAAAERLLERLDESCIDCVDRLVADTEAALPAVRTQRVVLRDGSSTTLRARIAAPRGWPDVVVCFLQLGDRHDGAVADGLRRRLSGRERDVAERIARGMRDSEIADELHLSEHTVRTHIKSIFRKTGAANRVALTRMLLVGSGRGGAPPRG